MNLKTLRSLSLAAGLMLGTGSAIAQSADPTELAFWETVRTTENAEMLQLYIETYPAGAFTDLAKVMIAQLSGDISAPSREKTVAETAKGNTHDQRSPELENAVRTCDALVGNVETYLRPDDQPPVLDLSDADLGQARVACQTASQTGDPAAHFKHFMTFYAAMAHEDRAVTAEEWSVLLKAAEAEFPAAIVWIGRMYLGRTDGAIPQNEAKAGVDALEHGVALKQEHAAFELGLFYSGAEPFYGRNLSRDFDKAVQYFAKAEALGTATPAAYEQAALYQRSGWSGYSKDAAVAAYERSIARGQHIVESHGNRGGLLARPVLEAALNEVPRDIIEFLSDPVFSSGFEGIMTAAKLGWDEGDTFWSDRALELMRDVLFVTSDAVAINYEKDFQNWRSSGDSTKTAEFLSDLASAIETEMVMRFEQDPHGESGGDAESMRAWREEFDRLMDNRLGMFYELNEITGWDVDFPSARECIEWGTPELVSDQVVIAEAYNGCLGDVQIAVRAKLTSHTGQTSSVIEQLEITQMISEELRFQAPFDIDRADFETQACYVAQGKILRRTEGGGFVCERDDPQGPRDMVVDYFDRRASLKTHVAGLLDAELEQY